MRCDFEIEGKKASRIILPTDKAIYRLLHDKKLYIKIPAPKLDPSKSMAPHAVYKDSMEFVKREKISGIPANKYRAVTPKNKEEIHIWMTEDDRWPIRITYPDGVLMFTYKNISTDFSETVFSIPGGYSEYKLSK